MYRGYSTALVTEYFITVLCKLLMIVNSKGNWLPPQWHGYHLNGMVTTSMAWLQTL